MKKPFALLWIFFGGIVVFSWAYLPTLSKYRDLKLQQDDLEQQIQKLTSDIETIREERDLLKNDVEYLEKIIRDEMGLVKPGEIVYKFVQDQPEAPEPSPEPAASPSPSVAPAPAASPAPAITVQAKPVISPKPNSSPVVVSPRKPLGSQTQPQYPRRETR